MKIISALLISMALLTTSTSANSSIINVIKKKQEIRKQEKRKLDRQHSRYAQRGNSGVSGVLIDTSGSPISNFSIEVLDKYGYVHGYSSTYSSSGKFSISGLYSGDYTLKIDNYSSNKDVYLGGDTLAVKAQWFTLTENEIKNFDTLVVTFPGNTEIIPRDTFNISGKVSFGDSTNFPSDASISFSLELRDANPEPTNGTVITSLIETQYINVDSLGNFSKTLLYTPGEYYALIKNLRWNSSYAAPLWVTGEKLNETPASITVPGSLNGVELNCEFAASLKGTAFDKNGDTITGSTDILLINEEGYEIESDWLYDDQAVFSFTGIPAGNYYLKTDWANGYSNNWYYPGTKDISQATKITLLPGEVSTCNFTLDGTNNVDNPGDTAFIRGTVLGHNGDTLDDIEMEVHYENSGEIDWIWDYDSQYTANVKANQKFKMKVAANFWNSPNIYSAETWYPNSTSKKDAAVLTVNKGDTLTADFTLLTGGSIAGFAKDSLGNNVALVHESWDDIGNAWEFYSEYFIMAFNTIDSTLFYMDYVDENILGGFRIPGVAPGDYYIKAFPFSEYYEIVPGAIDTALQPVGYNCQFTDTVTVTAENTTEIVLNVGNPVSGIIKGSYTFDNASKYDDDILVYAFNSDGTIASLAWSEYDNNLLNSTKEPAIPFSYYYPVDSYTWKQLYDSTSVNKGISASIILSLLGAGDYYIALLFWNEDNANEEMLMHWYGMDEPLSLNINDINEIDLLNFNTIPSDAKTINLATDSSVVSGIDFGSTPITPYSKNISSSIMSTPIIQNGVLKFNYNIPKDLMANSSIELYSLQGKKIYSKKLIQNSGSHVIDLKGKSIANGMYVAKLQAGNKSINKALMILK